MKPKQLGLTIVILSVIIIMLMAFFKIQFDKQQLQACTETCSDNRETSCTIESCPYHKDNNLSQIPIIVSILIAGLGGIGTYLLLSKEEKIIHQKEYDISGLDKEEKRTFHLIKNKEGGIYQSDLVKSLDLSKVKVTRILDKLEQKGLVERKRRGMTNVIVLR